MYNIKQDVIEKIKQVINYIEGIEKLKEFWIINNEYIKKITAHYFSFSNPQEYLQNPYHYDNLIKSILDVDTGQIKEKLENLNNILNNSEST